MIRPCEICGKNPGTQRHHCFPQFKRYRKKYGDMIDAEFNIRYVCADCHTGHNKIPREWVWSEERFLEKLRMGEHVMSSDRNNLEWLVFWCLKQDDPCISIGRGKELLGFDDMQEMRDWMNEVYEKWNNIGSKCEK